MNKTFFITGLPRTRTAWLANFFTHGKSFCWHDAMKHGFKAFDLIEQLKRVPQEYAGDADSGLVFIAPELVSTFPQARWFIIHRDVDEARASYERRFADRPYPGGPTEPGGIRKSFELCLEKLFETRKAIPDGQYIEADYADLNSKLVLEEAWHFLTPGNAWQPLRFELLDGLETNVYPEKVKLWQSQVR